ncbi:MULTISPECIES: TonB-dependent siderophore receptor [unclassified Acinetobacter]|uniref:TonB-dependent siderophore receptor n=1 Tax=unclassified Acinetobacter TaxID=196816 RepID=UPI00190CB8F4|nr:MULTISPECIES: TonB-dependent siderophore receptor [unclassified Acinetobacter]MBK0062217.1 TonB-dependent siderophore receptor [Acinetobacter sp. S55]MBK0066021.1 TonB-dependent siderophore receptor [Acinetobacter sp. S54]
MDFKISYLSYTIQILLLSASSMHLYAANASQTNDSTEEAQQLPTIIVKAENQKSETTEGTGSYTTPVTSAATGLALSLKETPQMVSVYTQQQMKDQGLTQLMDVASIAAGLSVSSSGGYGSDSSPIYSRGFTINNYLLDGVKQLSSYDSIYQSQDMAIFDRVEVIRGASGLMTGAGSPSASINLVKKKPLPTQYASINVTGGSWDFGRVETDVSSPLNEDGSIRGRLIMAVQKNDSYINNLSEDRKVIYGVVEGDIGDKTKLSFAFNHSAIDLDGSSRGGLPAWFSDGTKTSWARSATAGADWAYSNRENTGLYLDLEHNFNENWTLKSTLSRVITDSDELIGYVLGTPNKTTGSGLKLWASRWDYRPIQDVFSTSLNGKFELFGLEHQAVLGTTLAQNKNDKRQAYSWNTTSDPNWNTTVNNIYEWNATQISRPDLVATGWYSQEVKDYSAYAAFKFQLHKKLSLLTGARVEDWKTDNIDYSYADSTTTRDKRHETGEVTPYVGLVFDINDYWSIYSSYTTIFQPQNYKNINNQMLDPLEGKSTEIGLKGAFYDNMLNIAAAVYKTKQDNVASALYDENGDPLTNSNGETLYEALSGTESKGIEFEVSGQILPEWQVSTSFSRNISRDSDDQRINTDVPQTTARIFTTYVLPYLDKSLQIGGGVRWQSEIYKLDSGPNKVKLDQGSYALVDLMARYKFNQNLSGNLNIANLFDKNYYTTIGNSYYGTPRSFRLGLTYTW